MKDKPIVVIVMLLGGAVSCICSIMNGAGLLWTLLTTLITLFAFMLIGLCVNKVYAGIKADLDAIKAEEERIEEERKAEAARIQNERNEWYRFHPDEPYPGDLEQTDEVEADGEEQQDNTNAEEGV